MSRREWTCRVFAGMVCLCMLSTGFVHWAHGWPLGLDGKSITSNDADEAAQPPVDEPVSADVPRQNEDVAVPAQEPAAEQKETEQPLLVAPSDMSDFYQGLIHENLNAIFGFPNEQRVLLEQSDIRLNMVDEHIVKLEAYTDACKWEMLKCAGLVVTLRNMRGERVATEREAAIETYGNDLFNATVQWLCELESRLRTYKILSSALHQPNAVIDPTMLSLAFQQRAAVVQPVTPAFPLKDLSYEEDAVSRVFGECGGQCIMTAAGWHLDEPLLLTNLYEAISIVAVRNRLKEMGLVRFSTSAEKVEQTDPPRQDE